MRCGVELEQSKVASRLKMRDSTWRPSAQSTYMILAFAQQLYLLFDDDELVSFVKEAGEKSAGAIKYGDDRDC